MKKSHVFIIFADISFLLCGILCVGYIFVTTKEHEPKNVMLENNVLFEKGIEFPKLEGKSSMIHMNNLTQVEILVPQEGGRFIIDGNPVLKTELVTRLKNVKDKSVAVSIDQNAPSGDTLYLFSILDKFNSNITVLHLSEE